MKTLIGRIRPLTTKITNNIRRVCPKDKKMMPIVWKKIPNMKTTHNVLQKGGMILSCPKYLKAMKEMKICVLEVGDIISGLILTQTTQKTLDTEND